MDGILRHSEGKRGETDRPSLSPGHHPLTLPQRIPCNGEFVVSDRKSQKSMYILSIVEGPVPMLAAKDTRRGPSHAFFLDSAHP